MDLKNKKKILWSYKYKHLIIIIGKNQDGYKILCRSRENSSLRIPLKDITRWRANDVIKADKQILQKKKFPYENWFYFLVGVWWKTNVNNYHREDNVIEHLCIKLYIIKVHMCAWENTRFVYKKKKHFNSSL